MMVRNYVLKYHSVYFIESNFDFAELINVHKMRAE